MNRKHRTLNIELRTSNERLASTFSVRSWAFDVRCSSVQRYFSVFVVLLLAILDVTLTGCATRPLPAASTRPFSFDRDTFSFANELKWEYHFAPDGTWQGKRREPEPDYALHCFVVARSCRQFFQNARFDASQPKADDGTYRELIRKVVTLNPRRKAKNKIIIPGYTDLRAFSRDHEALLKEECGGSWQSYVQRGNWRMVFPFSRAHQQKMAEQLCQEITRGKLPVAHVVRFPDLSINHAVVLFDVTRTDDGIGFSVYDPNQPDAPITLTFDREKRAFLFPQSNYFTGGPVDVYEIYRSLLF